MTSKQIIFGYWAQRARGMPIRFLLQYVEANYIEKTYHFENSTEWLEKDKKDFQPFANLPYIQDGDLYLTETDTLIKYIAKRYPKYHQLLGVGHGNDEFRVDQLINIVNEIRAEIRDIFNNPQWNVVKRDMLKKQQKKLNQLVEFRGNNKFLLPYLSIADFKFIELLLYYKCLDDDLFNQSLPSLNSYITNFYSLPRISEYVKTDNYRRHQEFFPAHRAVLTGKQYVEEFNNQLKQ